MSEITTLRAQSTFGITQLMLIFVRIGRVPIRIPVNPQLTPPTLKIKYSDS
jgi:hypothetical protein